MQSDFDLEPAAWATLRSLLDEALTLPAAERESWLAGLPARHAEFRQRLRSLLSHVDTTGGAELLATLPKMETGDFAPQAPPGAPATEAGQLVGPYRLLRQIGEGGMASVWLAERTDLLQSRRVALKLPHGAWRRAGLAQRLAREREILATLSHPHIARLYDAGLAADGQPYLALEHVEGERIDVHCRERGLGVTARLELFLQVAHAVAYAHARLVVHRDLKPSNILVTADGQVRLLDFGIATLLEQGVAEEGELTQELGRALTPDYAAPEQIRGEPIGTAADIYSLGVVLYELLTGHRPYKLASKSRAALEHAIEQAEPQRPSDAVDDPRLRKELRGDLDAIVLEALKKSPAQRWPSVAAFADDLCRWRDGRPVLARPDSRWYRASKFVVRNAVAVGAATAVVLALTGGAALALWQAHEARAEAQRALEVKKFVSAILTEANPYLGQSAAGLTAVDLVKQADKRLHHLASSRPEVRVELTSLLADSLMMLNDFDAAEPIVQRALADARSTLGHTHPQTLHARLLQAQIDRLRGRTDATLSALDEMLPLLRAQADADVVDLLGVLQLRGLVMIDRGAYAQAEEAAREAATLSAARLPRDNAHRVGSAILLGLAYRYNKKFEQARDASKAALELAVEAYGNAGVHPRVVEAQAAYGRALGDVGDLQAGIAQIEKAAAGAQSLYGPSGMLVGILVQNLVGYQLDLGDLDRAEANSARALQIMASQTKRESYTYAATAASRGAVLTALRRTPAALELLDDATATLDKLLGPAHEVTLTARTYKALALANSGQLAAAQAEMAAVTPHAGAGVASHVGARAAVVEATIARLRGEPAAAAARLQPVVEAPPGLPKFERERMRAWAELGLSELARGEPTRAANALERALERFEKLESQVTPARTEALLALRRTKASRSETGGRAGS